MKRTRLPYTQEKRGVWYHVKRQGAKVVWTKIGGNPASDPEAMRLYHRLNSGLPVGEIKPKNTISALIDSFMASPVRFKARKKSTQDSYRRTLEKIRAKTGDMDCRRFTRPSIIGIRDKLAAISTREADKQVTMYSLLFEHAIDRGLLTHNPAKGVARVNRAVERKAWPSWAVAGLREHADQTTRTIMELALGTAQRLDDCLGMTWSDIEDDGINVIQQKTGQGLWVPFTPALKAYLATLPRSLTYIVHNGKGERLDRHRAQKLLAAVRPLYGGEAYTWHGLRYNAAEELGDRTDEEVGAITGHRSPQMVRKYTGKGRQRKLAKAARRTGTEQEC